MNVLFADWAIWGGIGSGIQLSLAQCILLSADQDEPPLGSPYDSVDKDVLGALLGQHLSLPIIIHQKKELFSNPFLQ